MAKTKTNEVKEIEDLFFDCFKKETMRACQPGPNRSFCIVNVTGRDTL